MKIHLLGDSLVQTRQPDHGKFYRGWGDMLSAFLSPCVEVVNPSFGGRSSRSFLNEGRFYDNGQFTTQIQPLGIGPSLDKIEKGDYVFIQFMCNDDDSGTVKYRPCKQVYLGDSDKNGIFPTVVPHKDMLTDTKKWNDGSYEAALHNEGYSDAEIEKIVKETDAIIALSGKTFYAYDTGATYKGYLKFYIDQIREKGANPILIISGAKCVFTDGKIKPISGYYGGKNEYCDFTFVEAQKQLANEMSVPAIDLFETEKTIYEMIGEEKASLFHNISVSAGDVEKIDEISYEKYSTEEDEWVTEYERRLSEGNFLSVDRVHKNPFGAFYQAALITDALLKKGILKDSLKREPIFLPQIPEPLKTEEIFSVFEFVNLFENA